MYRNIWKYCNLYIFTNFIQYNKNFSSFFRGKHRSFSSFSWTFISIFFRKFLGYFHHIYTLLTLLILIRIFIILTVPGYILIIPILRFRHINRLPDRLLVKRMIFLSRIKRSIIVFIILVISVSVILFLLLWGIMSCRGGIFRLKYIILCSMHGILIDFNLKSFHFLDNF